MSISVYDLVGEILQKTRDGEDLEPSDLYLVQEAVNKNLTEAGEMALNELYESVKKGYKKPWFHGIENMTRDHEGFIYWRGVQVEHYDFHGEKDNKTAWEREEESIKELEERCKTLEKYGIKPNSRYAIWYWDVFHMLEMNPCTSFQVLLTEWKAEQKDKASNIKLERIREAMK